MIKVDCKNCGDVCRLIDIACFRRVTGATGPNEHEIEPAMVLAQEYRLGNIIGEDCLSAFCAALKAAESLDELEVKWKRLATETSLDKMIAWWTYYYYLTSIGNVRSTPLGERVLTANNAQQPEEAQLDNKARQVLGVAQAYSGKLKAWVESNAELFDCLPDQCPKACGASESVMPAGFRSVVKR